LQLTGPPTAWKDPAAAAIGAVLGEYNRGARRSDLGRVRELLGRFAAARPRHHVVIVGTNGKTSTATFLARLLAGRGTRVGLFTSPHIARWSERVRIDEVPVEDAELIATLTAVHRRASEEPALSPDLRFFDLLTVAAEDIFGRAGVEVAVFEAGIGGGRDATRVLEPELVALTGVGDDHRDLLGSTSEEVLVEKLAAAPAGATLVAGSLGSRLTTEARLWAAGGGVELVEAGGLAAAGGSLPEFQRRNLGLAVRTAELAVARFGLPAGAPDGVSRDDAVGVWGRFEAGEVDGVRYLADVAHNQTAWLELLSELTRIWPPRRWVAVLAVTAERRPSELAAAVAGTEAVVHVIATITPVRAASDPAEIVVAFERTAGRPTAEVCDAPEAAFSLAADLARRRDLDLLVTGSNYLVSGFLAWVANRTES